MVLTKPAEHYQKLSENSHILVKHVKLQANVIQVLLTMGILSTITFSLLQLKIFLIYLSLTYHLLPSKVPRLQWFLIFDVKQHEYYPCLTFFFTGIIIKSEKKLCCRTPKRLFLKISSVFLIVWTNGVIQ